MILTLDREGHRWTVSTVPDAGTDPKSEKLALFAVQQESLKLAIEAKKGKPLTSPNDCGTYASEVDNLQCGKPPKHGTKEWYIQQRSPKWLEIDHLVTEADRAVGGKMVLLFLVPKTGGFIRFNANDSPKIDWGDGTITEGGTIRAQRHHVKWEDLPESTTLENGDRQAIVTLTAYGKALTYFNPTNDGYMRTIGAVEMIAIGSFMQVFNFGVYEELESYRLIGLNNLTISTQLPRALKYIERDFSKQTTFTNEGRYFRHDPIITYEVSNATSLTYMFYNTLGNYNGVIVGTPKDNWSARYMYGIILNGEIKAIDYSKCSNFELFAYSSQWLKTTPLIDMGNSTNNKRAFENCYTLNDTNIINCKSSISFYGCYKFPLVSLIKFGLTGIQDLTGKPSQEVKITQSMCNQELQGLGDIDTITYEGVDYTQAQVIALFTDKNWTLKRN